jgi:hypothetical protein
MKNSANTLNFVSSWKDAPAPIVAMRKSRVMRIASFAFVSWLGPKSPFLLVWIVNTTDAIMLSWCAILKKDLAYSILNVFWVIIGIIGICRAGALIH